MSESAEEKVVQEQETPETKVIFENINLSDLIKTAVNAGRKAEREDQNNERKAQDPEKEWFKKTERLLYSYPDLLVNIKEEEKEIEQMIMGQYEEKRKSKDFVFIPMGGGSRDKDKELEERIRSRKERLARTKREVERIDRALELIRWKDIDAALEDTYYEIIPLKYFHGMKEEDIAEMDGLKCNPSTIYRNKGRLVGRLKNILFGADALPR